MSFTCTRGTRAGSEVRCGPKEKGGGGQLKQSMGGAMGKENGAREANKNCGK